MRGSVCLGVRGIRRDSLRRVLGVSRVKVCDGCPGPGTPGRTECAWVRRAILLGCLVACSMLNSGSKGLEGVKGVRSPKYGVLLGVVGRAMGRRGWTLECACISSVESYLWAEGDLKGI